MALSSLAKNIRRFADINAQRKALEKEEEALKAYFKKEAGLTDCTFEEPIKKLLVTVSHTQETRIDLEALRLELGDKVKRWEKAAAKVTVRVGALPVKVAA